MLTGTFVVSRIVTPGATWFTLILLLAVHLAMNYAAVRAVCMRSLNRQRANIVFSHLIAHDRVLTPAEVSARERIFERDGALRWLDGTYLGHCRMGASLGDLAGMLGPKNPASGSYSGLTVRLSELMQIYRDERYLLSYNDSQRHVAVVLKRDASSTDQLKAWGQALQLVRSLSAKGAIVDVAMLRNALESTTGLLDRHRDQLIAAGWDLDIAALETRPSCRVATDRGASDDADEAKSA